MSMMKLLSLCFPQQSPHSLCDDGRPVVAAEPHAVRLLPLLECDDELVVGLTGLTPSCWQDCDEVTVLPLVCRLHCAWVVRCY